MKKITLLLALVLMSAPIFAQTVVIDRPANLVNSLIDVKGNDGTGVYCADQFELTSETTLGDLEIYGTNSNNGVLGALLTGFNVFIYEDDGFGLPVGNPETFGTGIVEIENIPVGDVTLTEDGIGASNMKINLTVANGGTQVVLPAGLYWLSAFPSVDSAPTGDGRYNWGLSDATPAVEPVLIDPADLFGLGVLDWSNIAALIGADATGMAWTLTDEPPLAIGDNLAAGTSIYPNPTSSILNVRVPSNVEINSAQLFDVLGRDTGLTLVNGTMDTSNLSRGVYLLNLKTTSGTLTQKVIKN